jgi:hypothetical protein
MHRSLLECWTPYAVVCNLYSWIWAYRCPKHVEIFMIINKIVASSWYLSLFSYMMHGHTCTIISCDSSAGAVNGPYKGKRFDRLQSVLTKGWFTLYVTFPLRRGTSPFSKLFSCLTKRRCSHWKESLRHVSVPFRRRPRARMFDITARVLHYASSVWLHWRLPVCLKKWMKN